MLDYGRRLEFGISIIPEAASVAQACALVVAADATGVDLVGIQDHPYQRRFLDTSPFGNLLAVTERIPSLGNLALEPLDGLHAIIDGAAQAADRDPATIRRLLNFGGQIGMAPAAEGGLGSLGGEALSGNVDEWVARLAGWATSTGSTPSSSLARFSESRSRDQRSSSRATTSGFDQRC